MRRLISSGSRFEAESGYSRAVVDGDWIFVAGTTGFDYAHMTIVEDPAEQARQAFRNIEAALAEAGSALADVVRVHYFLPDAADWPTIVPVLGEVFGAIRPAATALICGLVDLRMKIEIEVTARRGSGERFVRLTDEQRMLRDVARDFARTRLAPFAAERDREARFPAEAVAELGKLGLMGMLVPEVYGGAGADHVGYALALEEIAAGEGAVSTILSVQNSVGCMPVLQYGSEEQKQRFLKPMARGEMLSCFCLTEPQAGSDAAAIRTRARRHGNRWVLNGTKQFITSGKNADIAIVFAVTDPAHGKKGISAFLVPTDSPGFRVAGLEHKLGQRASDTAQLVFEEVELTPDLMLGAEGEGYRIALSNLEGGRIGVGAQSVGMARAAYEAALGYAREREAFGKPIIEQQAVAFRLADMATQIAAARGLVLDAAARRDAGEPCMKEAAMAKLFASEMAERVASDAIQIHGGYGYVADFPVERIYRDVRVCQIYEGTSDIQRLVIAREIAKD